MIMLETRKSIFPRCLSHSKPASGWILETIGSKPLSHQRCNSMEFILMQSTYDRFGLPPFPVRNSHHHNFYMLRLGDPEVNLHLPRVRAGARGIPRHRDTPPTLSRQQPPKPKLLLTFDPHNGIFKQVLERKVEVKQHFGKTLGFVEWGRKYGGLRCGSFSPKTMGPRYCWTGCSFIFALQIPKKMVHSSRHCKHGHEHAEMDMFYLVSRLEIPFGRFAGPKNNCFENVSKSHIRSLFLKSTVY